MGIYNKQEIINKIKEMGYINKKITYKEFKELYQKLGAGIKETYFADILGINYANYRGFKEEKNRATVLKNYELQEENVNEIRNKVTQMGYRNTAIDYEEFKTLYNILGKNMKESQFAQILGITYSNYNNMKKKGTRAKVLKDNLVELTKDEKEEIIQQIKKLGYVSGDSISYEEFMDLYEKFKGKLSKPDFAVQVLKINYSSYNDMKGKRTKARIFKDSQELTEQEKRQIREKLITDGYENTKISYEEFKQMHEKYGKQMSQSEFIKLLGIKYNNFHSMKSANIKTRILKRYITEEEKIEIKNDLVEQGYWKKSVDYKEFLKLYNKYGKGINETEFAEVVGMKYASYSKIKNNENKARILNSYIVPQEIRDGYDCIQILKNCSENGIDKKEALNYVKKLLNLTNKQILKEIDKCLENEKKSIESNEER